MAGVPKRLTEKQMKFAQLLVVNEGRKTPTQCAIEAGYEEDSAYVRASELRNPQRYPLVVKYTSEIREEYQNKYDIHLKGHIAELGRLRDEARKSKAWSAGINAEIARGKAGGLYVEQKMILTGKMENTNKEEMRRAPASILNEYSPLMDEGKDIPKKSSSKMKKVN